MHGTFRLSSFALALIRSRVSPQGERLFSLKGYVWDILIKLFTSMHALSTLFSNAWIPWTFGLSNKYFAAVALSTHSLGGCHFSQVNNRPLSLRPCELFIKYRGASDAHLWAECYFISTPKTKLNPKLTFLTHNLPTHCVYLLQIFGGNAALKLFPPETLETAGAADDSGGLGSGAGHYLSTDSWLVRMIKSVRFKSGTWIFHVSCVIYFFKLLNPQWGGWRWRCPSSLLSRSI